MPPASQCHTLTRLLIDLLRSGHGAINGDSDSWESWDDAPEIARLEDGQSNGNKPWLSDLKGLGLSLHDSQQSSGADEDGLYGYATDAAERAYLVGVQLKQQRSKYGYTVLESIEELGRLADTAGLEVVGHTYQLLEEVNPRTYIGSGKVGEVMRAVEESGAETVIFDDELSPGQLRNLERALGGKVRLCDRTALILDIFSQRAATREGKLQVELAQSEYQLPRLTRMWSHLERQSGSGQVKGMGEKQIEVDRRLLKGRMARLRKDIEEVRTHRRAYRERRASAPIPVVALVGYTNAGKSTLLNRLTDAGVLAEDKLFATLDPTTRRVELAGGQEVLFTDTVGFIQKLPTQLVAAFRATLEEIKDASLLVHCVDVSHPNAAAQIEAVNAVLEELGVQNIPTLTVWNKVDACADPPMVQAVAAKREGTACISALTGEGVDDLLQRISNLLKSSMVEVHVCIPYNQGELVDEIHRTGVVESTEFTESGTEVRGRVPPSLAMRLRQLRLEAAAAAAAATEAASQAVVYDSLLPLVFRAEHPIPISQFTQAACDVLLPVLPSSTGNLTDHAFKSQWGRLNEYVCPKLAELRGLGDCGFNRSAKTVQLSIAADPPPGFTPTTSTVELNGAAAEGNGSIREGDVEAKGRSSRRRGGRGTASRSGTAGAAKATVLTASGGGGDSNWDVAGTGSRTQQREASVTGVMQVLQGDAGVLAALPMPVSLDPERAGTGPAPAAAAAAGQQLQSDTQPAQGLATGGASQGVVYSGLLAQAPPALCIYCGQGFHVVKQCPEFHTMLQSIYQAGYQQGVVAAQQAQQASQYTTQLQANSSLLPYP
ncbi:hypothetical protein N2152v2_002840 [Parachlorella kessleri]